MANRLPRDDGANEYAGTPALPYGDEELGFLYTHFWDLAWESAPAGGIIATLPLQIRNGCWMQD